jgi:hypothetical protein
MNASKRIYRPGAKPQPEQETRPGRPNNNGAAHPSAEPGVDEVPPFPIASLPPAAAKIASAIAHTERTPEALAGCCALGMLSASIGAGLEVRSGPNRLTRGNLYIVASAESGSGKSETFRHAARPIHDYERRKLECWQRETLPKVESEIAILESEIAHLKKDAGKEESAIEREAIRGQLEQKMGELAKAKADRQAPALCCEDVTSERLAVMLSHNGEQLASISPDAGSIVNNLLGRYNKLDRTDENIYLKGFSGDYCRVDRQGREPVVLEQPCLTALWLVQPDKVETLLAERSLTDGGLIPRLLICHTCAQPRPIVEGAKGIPPATANAWANLIQSLIATFRLGGEPVVLEPTPEALKAMNANFNGIVQRRLAELKDVTTFAARWNEQAWRIAVCVHAGLHGERAGERRLELETVECAIGLADWFAGEQLRILAGGRMAARRAKLDEVFSLLVDNPAGITARDLQRARITRTSEEAHALLISLEAEGELTGRDSKPEQGGKISRIYTKARGKASVTSVTSVTRV